SRERLAQAARRRQRMRGQAVGAPGAVEKDDGLQAPPPRRRLEGIAGLVRKRARIDLVTLRRADPTAGRQDDGHGLVRNERGLVDRLRGLALDDPRAPRVSVFLRILLELLCDELLQPRLAAEQALDFLLLGLECLALLADLHLLELREVAQTGIEDLLGLLVRELEALHQ